ncbi:MAG: GPP34 family phosphoprotein [Anaerolineaceae bacterium]|nr:GPP34 family phosphoprotein [Anaerolineaceae bacterium]
MLILAEELFILALDPEKGNIPGSIASQLQYGLSGALLAELALMGKIGIDDKKKLELLDLTLCGDELLDRTLMKIIKSDRLRKMTHWVKLFSSNSQRTFNELGERLVDKGILKKEPRKYLWVIPSEAFPEKDASAKYLIKNNLRAVVLTNKKPDPYVLALLSLVRACNMLESVFTKDELKLARKLVDQKIHDVTVGKEVAETIQEIEAAALAGVFASVAG